MVGGAPTGNADRTGSEQAIFDARGKLVKGDGAEERLKAAITKDTKGHKGKAKNISNVKSRNQRRGDNGTCFETRI
jgi:hypothetical protein